MVGKVIDVPDELAAAQEKFNGAAGRAFVAGLPRRAAHFLGLWGLSIDGPAMHGVSALVLPVVRHRPLPGGQHDGPARAALKLQLLDEESAGEPVALRLWDGDGSVRLLEHDTATCTLLLERLDETRLLTGLPDAREAVLVIAGLLARLTAVPAPAGLRRLGDVAHAMLEQVPWALARVPDPADRRLVRDCAAAVREVLPEPGDRLLHWDLHFDNVLGSDRADWLAIDPKPLAGDPGFDLLPALDNRYDPGEVRWRFDALTGVLGLDRERARAWTLARVLQNCLWEIEDGRPLDAVQLEIGRLLRR
ncbi:hydroxyurea phosphotransferase [Streptomyces sp. Tue6028]|uniref:aminoglycoside phosphotransferase family protein n=1 Tax=Streptomyces sp. Tue6028 TaxID=2036037 RepID=UPI000BB2E3EE|nr:aminoglycoside phosphotransferase family protein [Streptomyces sp. Tue6028]PBC62882.1 hydroxyurea phosphotransferase [Streptomyces sp. Tue6028]